MRVIKNDQSSRAASRFEFQLVALRLNDLYLIRAFTHNKPSMKMSEGDPDAKSIDRKYFERYWRCTNCENSARMTFKTQTNRIENQLINRNADENDHNE